MAMNSLMTLARLQIYTGLPPSTEKIAFNIKYFNILPFTRSVFIIALTYRDPL